MERLGDRDTLDELTALADDLLEQATEIRRQWAELGQTLGLEAPEPVIPAERRDDAADDVDAARLVALDMMLSGRSRDEVREYLTATFGEGDREQLLDDIFSQYGG